MQSIASLLIPGQTSSPQAPPRTPKDLIKATLYETYRITTTDGRAFVGSFLCIDKSLNIILSQAEEFLPEAAEEQRPEWWPRSEMTGRGTWGGRQVGMVLIPGREVVKAEVVASDAWMEEMEASKLQAR